MQAIVSVKQGALEGLLSADGQTLIFRGVPYAQPPVGELRFRRPAEKAPWEGVLPCKQWAPSCPQADVTTMEFYGKEFYSDGVPPLSEDCLYLNIWTPADARPDSALPVLFWIHGGAFLNGCGAEKEFDGEGFAKKGVILVTINYRLNAFGFFAHPDLERENEEGVSGNYGILDAIFALKWVRENIAAFGGDPEKVTIAGQSAGCMSVQTIISSPLSRGLLRGAILQSGGGIRAFGKGGSMESAYAISQKAMELLGVSSIEELRAVPGDKLCEAAYGALGGFGLGWAPCIDGWLLPADTDTLAKEGKIHDVSYMIGSCGDDMGGGEAADLLQNAAAAFCENQLSLGRKPAFRYLFDRKLPGDEAGAFHSSELWYEFETLSRCWRPFEPHDYDLAGMVSGYWANFVKNGDPNGPGLPQWEPYSTQDPDPAVLV